MLYFAVDNERLFYELFTVALSHVDVKLRPHNLAILSPLQLERLFLDLQLVYVHLWEPLVLKDRKI